MNGAPWHEAVHRLVALTGPTDASSGGWGGLHPGLKSEVLEAAGDFPDDRASSDIKVQEQYVLLDKRKFVYTARSSQ